MQLWIFILHPSVSRLNRFSFLIYAEVPRFLTFVISVLVLFSSTQTMIANHFRELFSLIFRAPETSYLPWHIVFGQPHWRQEFVFAMIPILFQEVWRARQYSSSDKIGGDTTAAPPCMDMAQRDEESFPFPAWTPKFPIMEAKPKVYRLVG